VISDINVRSPQTVPVEMMQFVYDTDRQTFDEIATTDFPWAKSYCFDHESLKPILKGSAWSRACLPLYETTEQVIAGNKDMTFAYINQSVFSNMILHKKDNLVIYMSDLLVYDTIKTKYSYSNLQTLMINSLALGNEKIAIHILDIFGTGGIRDIRNRYYSYDGDSYKVAITLLLVKIDKPDLLERFGGEVKMINILHASIICNSDICFDYAFKKLYNGLAIDDLLKNIYMCTQHNNTYAFTSLVKCPRIYEKLLDRITSAYWQHTSITYAEHIGIICQPYVIFSHALDQIIESKKQLEIQKIAWIQYKNEINTVINKSKSQVVSSSGFNPAYVIKSKRRTIPASKPFKSRPQPKSAFKKGYR